jgi:DNA-binding transcriptional ArsR family regulator
MSIKVMHAVWSLAPHVPGSSSSRLILLALADIANDEGECWPGIKNLSEKCGLNRRAVTLQLARLEEAGLVKRTARFRDNGSQTSSMYHITLPVLTPPPAQDIAPPLRKIEHGGGAESDMGGAQAAAPLIHEPSVDPSVEPSVKQHPPPAASVFDAFWKSYPRKVGKKAAEKAWLRARDKPALEVILAALDVQKKCDQWTKEGGQFIPHPATWLNQGRWNDEPPETLPLAAPRPSTGPKSFQDQARERSQADLKKFLEAP